MKQIKLKQLLAERKISQVKLAEIANIEYLTLNKKINGKLPLTWNDIKSISKCLDIVNPFDVFI